MRKRIPVVDKSGREIGQARTGRAAAVAASASLALEERRKLVRMPFDQSTAAQYEEHVGIWGRGKRSYNFA